MNPPNRRKKNLSLPPPSEEGGSVARRIWKLSALLLLGALLAGGILLWGFSRALLVRAGELLVHTDAPARADVVVVLHTEGVEYHSRLVQAARLYREGYAGRVVINGNRKSPVLRDLEKEGFFPCCYWYEDAVRMLDVMGVPREQIIAISAEDVYDTVSEARAVGSVLEEAGVESVLLTTSRSHTRRAFHIWKELYSEAFAIRMVAAASDPYSPQSWWKSGRQIKWTLWEYGAWLFYWWKEWSGELDEETVAPNDPPPAAEQDVS